MSRADDDEHQADEEVDIVTAGFFLVILLLFIGGIIYAIYYVFFVPKPNDFVQTQISGVLLYVKSGDEVLSSNYNPHFNVSVYGGVTFSVVVSLYNFSKPVEVYKVAVASPLSLVSVSPNLPIIIEPNQRVNVTLQVSSPYSQSYNGPLSITVYVTTVNSSTATSIAGNYGPLGVPPYVLLTTLLVTVIVVAVVLLRR